MKRNNKHFIYKYQADHWNGVEPRDYKKDISSHDKTLEKQNTTSEPILYKNITRTEFILDHMTSCYELRYFEIAQHGFSRREKHKHCHTVIVVKGKGLLRIEDHEYELKPPDIAYIDSWQVHQLFNVFNEPFGFFCIVDKNRDTPLPMLSGDEEHGHN